VAWVIAVASSRVLTVGGRDNSGTREELMESHTASQSVTAQGVGTTSKRGRGLWRALARTMSLGMLLACIALGQATAQQNNEGLAVVPLKITNNGTKTAPFFVYIVGLLAANSNTFPAGKAVFVTDVQGNVDITPAIPANAPISLGLNVGTGSSISMMMPKLVGMRIYISRGNGLLVQTNSQEGAPPSAPCGWCGTGNIENTTNFNTIYDWAELTWVDKNGGTGHETNLGGNVTEVDLFGLPLLLTFVGNDPASISPSTVVENAGFTQKRPTILNAYQSLGAPWTSLLLSNGSGTRVRVIAPFHGIELGVFPATELDTYIGQVWNSSTLSLAVEASCKQDGGKLHKYIGKNSGGNLVFSENGVAKFQFSKPSTLTVYRNELQASPLPPDELTACLARVVAAKLGGALVRTDVLGSNSLDACVVGQFYVQSPVQKYAQLFHQFGVDKKAYSFGYDDTCEQSSFITVDSPTEVDIAISGGTPL
jgi:hypothetical protein